MRIRDLVDPGSQWRRWTAIVWFVVIGACGVGYGTWTAATPQHLVWGTFTQQSQACDEKKNCTAVGTWVSDDSTRRMSGVTLDGDVVGDGRQVAAALDTKDPNNLVHTAWGLELRTWMGWVVAACGFGAAGFGWWWTKRRPQDIHFL